MFFPRKADNTPANQGKELQKLKRQDLLELLVDQMRENDQLRATQASQEAALAQLAEKDAQLAHLRRTLNQRDRLLGELHSLAREIAQAKGPNSRAALLQQIEALVADNYLSTAIAPVPAPADEASVSAEPPSSRAAAASVAAPAQTAPARYTPKHAAPAKEASE